MTVGPAVTSPSRVMHCEVPASSVYSCQRHSICILGLQEIRETEEKVNWHQEDKVRKIWNWGYPLRQLTQLLQKVDVMRGTKVRGFCSKKIEEITRKMPEHYCKIILGTVEKSKYGLDTRWHLGTVFCSVIIVLGLHRRKSLWDGCWVI